MLEIKLPSIMSKDSFYFPHDSNATDDPKIMIMMGEWGLEAYGIYWIIIEHLRNQPGYRSQIAILKPLALRYNSTEEKFKSVVTRYGLFQIEDEVFFSLSLIARMIPLEEKRVKMKELADRRWAKDKEMRTHSVGNASKVKESKVEYSKEGVFPSVLIASDEQYWERIEMQYRHLKPKEILDNWEGWYVNKFEWRKKELSEMRLSFETWLKDPHQRKQSVTAKGAGK